MPDFGQLQLLTAEEFQRPARQSTRPRVTEEELKPYRETVAKLNDDVIGGVIPLSEDDNRKRVASLLQRAAKEKELAIRVYRPSRKEPNVLKFRRQTDDEMRRNLERGQALAESRKAGDNTGGRRKKQT